MRMLVLAFVTSSVVFAGCSDNRNRDGVVEPEADNGVFHVTFTASASATLAVPLPHLDSCQAPSEWMDGTVAAANAAAVLQQASDGRAGQVVAVTGQGRVSWSTQISLKTPCQTFRYDPWSIDPDVNETQIEVRPTAGLLSGVSVVVRWVRDGCGAATLYEGPVAAGQWSRLAGRTVSVGCP